MALSRPRSLLFAALLTWLIPFSIACLIINYTILVLAPHKNLRKQFGRTPGFNPKKVLITGAGTPYGLRLARAFHKTGHYVVGADYQDNIVPLPARWSISLLKFRRLKARADTSSADLIQELLCMAQDEAADLWIDCSRNAKQTVLAEVRRLILQRSSCTCFIAPDRVATSFSKPRSFLAFVSQNGLPVPDSHRVKSRDDIHNVLNQSRGKKRYLLKAPGSDTPTNPQTLLPRRTLSQTYNEVSKVKIKENAEWVLEQHLEGLQRYRTFSVLAKGEVQAFTACQASKMGSYQTLSYSPIHNALRRYLTSLADHMDKDLNCHICVDFCLDDRATEIGVEQRILPVGGELIADTIGLSFQNTEGSIDLVRAYLTALSPQTNGSLDSRSTSTNTAKEDVLRPSANCKGVYSFGNDILELLQVSFRFLGLQSSLLQLMHVGIGVLEHVLQWQEFVYDFSDPLPCWYLYQIYLPLRLFTSSFAGTQERDDVQAELKRMITMR